MLLPAVCLASRPLLWLPTCTRLVKLWLWNPTAVKVSNKCSRSEEHGRMGFSRNGRTHQPHCKWADRCRTDNICLFNNVPICCLMSVSTHTIAMDCSPKWQQQPGRNMKISWLFYLCLKEINLNPPLNPMSIKLQSLLTVNFLFFFNSGLMILLWLP